MPKLIERPQFQTLRNGSITRSPGVCETCLRRVATDSNKLAFYMNEFFYIASRSICIILQDSIKVLKFSLKNLESVFKKKESRDHADHVHVRGQLCERCLSARQRASNETVETISEQLYVAAQAFSLVAMLVGGFVFGLATLCMSVFPGSSSSSSPEQAEYEARRKAEDLRKKRQEEDEARQTMRRTDND